MTQLHPYLIFNGNCYEAMNFYQQCLEGETTFQTMENILIEANIPETINIQIRHSTLIKGSILLMASDAQKDSCFMVGNNMAISINCTYAEEMNNFFTKLSEGGKILEAISTKIRGVFSGSLTDKFGINWLFNFVETHPG